MPDTATSATLLYEQVGSGMDGTMYNGGCLDFDGTNDYVDCGTELGTNFGDNYTGGFSVSLWFKYDAAFAGLFNISSFSGQYGALSLYVSGYELIFRIGSDVATKVPMADTSSWHHVVGTYDGSTIKKIYLDGEFGDSDAYTAAIDFSGLKTILAGFWSNAYTMDGKVADVKIFNVALSAANIKELYDDSRVIIPYGVSQTNLKGWWPIIDGGGTIAYDGSGNGNNGTLTNMDPATDWTREGGAPALITGFNRPLLFKESDSIHVDWTNTQSLDDITLSAWVCPTAHNSYNPIIRLGGAFFLLDSTGTRLRLVDAWATSPGSYPYTFNLNQWYHVAATRVRSGNQILYVNGSAIYTVGAQSSSISMGLVEIGRRSTNYFNGLINEVVVYDGALSATEIAKLAARGPNGGPLPPDPVTGVTGYNSVLGYYRNDGDVTWADRSGHAGAGVATVYGSNLSSLLFKQGYNGTASTSTGRDGQGFPLLCKNVGALGGNDSTYYTAIGNGTPTQIGGLGSLEAWVFPTEDKWMYFYWKGYNADNSLYLGYHASAPDKWFFGSYYSSSYKYFYWRGVGQSTYADFANRWHCLTMTFDKTLASDNWKVYHNGVYADATDWTNDLGTSSHNVYVGGSRYWVGQIGPIRLYDRVLSPSEITQNFNAQRSRFNA